MSDMVSLGKGGDVTIMTKADNRIQNKKVPFTMRMDKRLSDRLDKQAQKLGISKSAYITLILKGELSNTIQKDE